jgi:hypothetical protein
MKIKNIKALLALLLGAIIVFSSCKKDDGAIPKNISIADVPVVSTDKDATGSTDVSLANPGAFTGKFKVVLYFPDAPAPTKVDVVVRKSASTSTVNNNNVKVFKTGITSFPASFTVTAAELATLFGASLALNQVYDFAPDIYVGDRKFEAFPAVGTGTGAGIRAMPFFNEFARFTVKP